MNIPNALSPQSFDCFVEKKSLSKPKMHPGFVTWSHRTALNSITLSQKMLGPPCSHLSFCEKRLSGSVLEEPQEENSRIWADKLIGEYKLPKSQETDFRIPGMHHTSTFSFSKHWISIHEV